MLNYLKQEANRTYTENGAMTNRSTGSELLDLFATVGALRRADEQEITDRFLRAWTEDNDLAMKLLFYARDVRGGLGERRVFRAVLRWLAVNEPKSLVKNLPLIAEYGRWDDAVALLDSPVKAAVVALLKEQLAKDQEALKQEDAPVSLLGKWLPSINAHNEDTVKRGRLLAKELGLSEREYRKTLSALRERIRILENNLREMDYSFDYAKQPSKAMFKYRKAFARNDRERYTAFLQRVQRGEATLHTGTLLPYELVDPYLGGNGRSFLMPLTPEEAQTLNIFKQESAMFYCLVTHFRGNKLFRNIFDCPFIMFERIQAKIFCSEGLRYISKRIYIRFNSAPTQFLRYQPFRNKF